ncbi:hypothetical protein SDC9_146200 [bioreactor metagenome]|uniref:Uncharacterized protein n=1 Tax=bioreactor metagenome TaxID=1076179 RepID=A0A645EB10_9ZZZZ
MPRQAKFYAGLPLYKHCALRYTNVNQSLLKGEGPPGPLTFFGFLMEQNQQANRNTAVQSGAAVQGATHKGGKQYEKCSCKTERVW